MKLKACVLVVLLTAILTLTCLDVYTILWKPTPRHQVYINLEQLITINKNKQIPEVSLKQQSESLQRKRVETVVGSGENKPMSELMICRYNVSKDLTIRLEDGYQNSDSSEINAYVENECKSKEKCIPKTGKANY